MPAMAVSNRRDESPPIGYSNIEASIVAEREPRWVFRVNIVWFTLKLRGRVMGVTREASRDTFKYLMYYVRILSIYAYQNPVILEIFGRLEYFEWEKSKFSHLDRHLI